MMRRTLNLKTMSVTHIARFLLLFATLFTFGFSAAWTAEPRHGLSAFGTLKYAPGFAHFDYVNPDAPKGGRLAMIGTASLVTFDSFNGYILKGDPAQGLNYLFDSLMVRAYDEPDAVYGLVARAVKLSDTGGTATFFLREAARFSDGSVLRAADIVASFHLLREFGHPLYALPLRDVVKVEAVDPLTVRYQFTGDAIRDLPMIVATLPIFSAAFYQQHKFDQSSLTPPLGSGPYAIADFSAGRYVTYRRRPDYWARGLPVNIGHYNFDELRYEYFRDRTAEFEALKAGAYDLREEFTSKSWATEYDLPQVRAGKLKQVTLSDHTPSGAQGFFINARRPKFQDARVREALGLAFDFEWTNRNQFFGLYQRTESFFENSAMKAHGTASESERDLLSGLGLALSPALLGPPISPPISDGTGTDRRLLRRAAKLLSDAGWALTDGIRQRNGMPLSIEFLIFAPTFERIIAPYIRNLKRLGIPAKIRRVDPAQYTRRLEQFDFDITTARFAISNTPGVEIRNYWSAAAADIPGSRNLAGIKDPAIDALIEKIIRAPDRDALTVATRALDRVLRAGHHWVPHWYKPSHFIAYWDKFGVPEIKPKYHRGIITTWWYDKAKAAALETNR